MTALIERQIFEIFIMFYCGLAIMLIFEVRNRCMWIFSQYGRVSKAIYFLSWLCAAFLFCQFLYRGSHGVISIYGIAALAAGIILWKKVIYGIIDRGIAYEKEEKKRADSGVRAERPTDGDRRIPRRKTNRRKEKKEKDKN